MNYLKISLCVFCALAASRFVPHPPNFTSLIALSFYVPAIFGLRFLPVVLISFAITDFFIEMHALSFFTWGSVVIVGLISKYFFSSVTARMSGVLLGAVLFFIISNFGVWFSGSYGYTLEGLLVCYTLAIPFFVNNIISTFIFSMFIEIIYWISKFVQVKSKSS